jgi:CheY-like chemotaxis protein
VSENKIHVEGGSNMSNFILLAEPDIYIRELITKSLASFGCYVQEVEDSKKLIKAIKKHHPDLCLLSYDFLLKKHFKVFAKFRKKKAFQKLSFILLVGSFEDYDAESVDIFFPEKILNKPFKIEDLLNAIAEVLSIPKIGDMQLPLKTPKETVFSEKKIPSDEYSVEDQEGFLKETTSSESHPDKTPEEIKLDFEMDSTDEQTSFKNEEELALQSLDSSPGIETDKFETENETEEKVLEIDLSEEFEDAEELEFNIEEMKPLKEDTHSVKSDKKSSFDEDTIPLEFIEEEEQVAESSTLTEIDFTEDLEKSDKIDFDMGIDNLTTKPEIKASELIDDREVIDVDFSDEPSLEDDSEKVEELDLSAEFEKVEELDFDVGLKEKDIIEEDTVTLNLDISKLDDIEAKDDNHQVNEEIHDEDIMEIDISGEFEKKDDLEFDIAAASDIMKAEISDAIEAKISPEFEEIPELKIKSIDSELATKDLPELDMTEEFTTSDELEFDIETFSEDKKDEITESLDNSLSSVPEMESLTDHEATGKAMVEQDLTEELARTTELEFDLDEEETPTKKAAQTEAFEIEFEGLETPDTVDTEIEDTGIDIGKEIELDLKTLDEAFSQTETGLDELVDKEEEVILLEEELPTEIKVSTDIEWDDGLDNSELSLSEDHEIAEAFFTPGGTKIEEETIELEETLEIDIETPEIYASLEPEVEAGEASLSEEITRETLSALPSKQEIQKMVSKIVSERIEQIIEETMWEIIPELTEKIIKKKIEENKQ